MTDNDIWRCSLGAEHAALKWQWIVDAINQVTVAPQNSQLSFDTPRERMSVALPEQDLRACRMP